MVIYVALSIVLLVILSVVAYDFFQKKEYHNKKFSSTGKVKICFY